MYHPIRTCFECRHAAKYAGHQGTMWEPPEPPEAECEHPDLIGTEELDTLYLTYIEHELPDHCGHFEPELIEHCDNCLGEMNEPAWIWPLWVHGPYTDIPVCSVRCWFGMTIKVDQQFEEMCGGVQVAKT